MVSGLLALDEVYRRILGSEGGGRDQDDPFLSAKLSMFNHGADDSIYLVIW